MIRSSWIWSAVSLIAMCALSGTTSAGDDIMRLDLKPSAGATANVAGGDFSHADRAQPNDDDLEDVTLRYWLGHWRGQRVNAGYGVPPTVLRWPLFRAGYATSTGYYPSYGYGGWAAVAAPRPVLYAQAPVVNSSAVVNSAWIGRPDVMASASVRVRMPLADETVPVLAAAPSYRYDRGPAVVVPMPARDGFPTVDPVVKLGSAKKLPYPAYGENRRTPEYEGTLTVKQTTN